MNTPAVLALEDGTVFNGLSIGAKGNTTGEVVFNTAMTGYQEILTDPSYCRQIVTLTYPHIGNTGTNPEDLESGQVYAAGLVIRDLAMLHSNWRSSESLSDFLVRGKVVAIADIDTRKLTRLLRDKGAQAGCIMTGEHIDPAAAVRAARKFPGLKGMDLAKVVTSKRTYQWNEPFPWDGRQQRLPHPSQRLHVVAYDFGIKRNILRTFAALGCRVTVVPATTPASQVFALNPDGVFLSNGPGDPAATAEYAVPAIRGVLASGKPVFGICLGHQLLALALGARTYKLERGHRGANQPVKDLTTGKVEITSQNHGFAVDEKTLPAGVRVTHVSLFDGSNEGLACDDRPAFSVQYHPEASPGPSDSHYLFRRFVDMIERPL